MPDLIKYARPVRYAENPREMLPLRCYPLNLILGGGLPLGHTHEWYGAEGSGKSTLAYECMKLAVDRGMIGILYDMEGCADDARLAKFGLVHGENMLHEDSVQSVEGILQDLRGKLKAFNKDKDYRRLFVVVDSVGATPPEAHLEKDLTEHPKIGADALAWKIVLKIFNRQMRNDTVHARTTLLLLNHQSEIINTGPFGGRGPKYTSPGGRALKHHAYIRAQIIRKGSIKNADGDVIGAITIVKTVKNKQTPAYQQADIPIYFGNPDLTPEEDYVGSWDLEACLESVKSSGLAKRSGNTFKMTLYNEADEPREVSWYGMNQWSDVYNGNTADLHRTMRWWHYRVQHLNQSSPNTVIQHSSPPEE